MICGNGTVRRMLDSRMLRTLQLRYLSLSLPGRMEQSLDDLRRLLCAYKDRDAGLAMALKRATVFGGYQEVRLGPSPGNRYIERMTR